MEECQICEKIRKTEAQLSVVKAAINSFSGSQILQSYTDMDIELSMLKALCDDAFVSENMESLKGKISRLDNDLVHVKDSFVICIKNRKKELENRIQTLKYEDQQYHAEMEEENEPETDNT